MVTDSCWRSVYLLQQLFLLQNDVKLSSTVKIMEAIINGMICPLYNSEIINEYADVLTRPKFRIPSHSVGEIINLIEKLGIESDRVHTDEIIKDLDDVVFYEVTLSK